VYVAAVLKLTLLLWYTWALLAPGVVWVTRRFTLRVSELTRLLPLHIAANVGFAIVAVALYRAGRALIGVPSARPFVEELVGGINTHVLTYWIIVGLVHALEYYRRARDREVKAAALAAELSEARLVALRMQLHPHFLFNTMHAISSAIREDPEAAEDMLAELADLLRTTIDRPPSHVVTLREELHFIERYVGIQKVRFGERLEVSVSVEDDLWDATVPALILQPLVENAIEHGIATRLCGGRLEVSARRRDSKVVLSVCDDGPGIRDAELHPDGWRIGLRNTVARLEQLYGDAASLELRNRDDGGLAATIILPWRKTVVDIGPHALEASPA